MKTLASLSVVLLLSLHLAAGSEELKEKKAESDKEVVTEEDEFGGRVRMEVLHREPTEEEDEAIIKTLNLSPNLRTSVTPGRYVIEHNTELAIQSDNFPNEYSDSIKLKWLLEPAQGVSINIECPIIRIQHSRECLKDKLAIWTGYGYRRGVVRCGDINNFSGSWTKMIKVIFRSNNDNTQKKGFHCTVRGEMIPTTTVTTTTTTVMPGCPMLVQPSSPSPVTSCSDLTTYADHCSCSMCGNEMSLKCDFCTLCDFNIFAEYQFQIPVMLDMSFSCSYTMDISGMFHHNANSIKRLKFCVDGMSHVTLPFSQFTSLEALHYQDCSNTTARACAYDSCPSGDVCTPSSRRLQGTSEKREESPISLAQSRAGHAHSISLPSPADVPNLKELYLADVAIHLDNSHLSFPMLETFCLNSAAGKVLAGTFNTSTNLKQVYVEICQTNLKDGAFQMVSDKLECIHVVDYCMLHLEPHSITLDGGCNPSSNTSIALTTTKDFLPFVPLCPFRPLLVMDCVTIDWQQETDCRNCGGAWYWSVTPDELSNLKNTCFNVATGSNTSVQDYVTNSKVWSACYFKLVPC